MSQIPAGLPAGTEIVPTPGFNRHIGPLYRLPDLAGNPLKRFVFRAAEQHMNSGSSVHGGMLMSFINIAMGCTARLVCDLPRCNMISMNSDFVGPGRLDELIMAEVRISRQTRTLLFLAGEVVSADRKILIASSLWNIATP